MTVSARRIAFLARRRSPMRIQGTQGSYAFSAEADIGTHLEGDDEHGSQHGTDAMQT